MRRLLIILLVIALVLPGAGTAFADTLYVVQAGDSLSRIAQRFGVPMSSIMAANGITNPNLIFVGQRLTIPGPGGSPVPTPVPGGAAQTYIVQRGDTLFTIARRFNVSMQAIMQASGISNANLIFVGQRLTIPGSGPTNPPPQPTTPPPAATQPPSTGSQTYIVQAGDSLSRIAQRFGVPMSSIMAANGITNPNIIFVGQRLIIPGTTGGTTNPPPQPTSVPPSTGGSFELGGQVSSFSAADRMKFAGMHWVKRQVKWTPGAVASAELITDAHAKGFKILLSVLGNPSDISNGANYDAYAAYVGELARLGADAIEVWNEQNIDREWPQGQINPVSYVDLLRRAYAQIKSKNPNTLVISGAPAPTGAEGAFGLDRVWNDDRYINGMVAAGAASYMDCIGLHYNEGIVSPTQTSGDPRDNYYTRYYAGMINKYFNAFGGARKICITELGYLSSEGYGPLPPAFGWAGTTSVAEHAQWLGEAANLSKNGGRVRMLIVFNVDFTLYGDDPQAGYAIIRPDGTCPACDTLRAVTGGR